MRGAALIGGEQRVHARSGANRPSESMPARTGPRNDGTRSSAPPASIDGTRRARFVSRKLISIGEGERICRRLKALPGREERQPPPVSLATKKAGQ